MARASLRRPVLAAPLSELILRPEGVLVGPGRSAEPVVIISRSGSTSEAVTVAERMRAAGHPTRRGHVPRREPARDRRRRDARLARRRRGGDRHDPVVREHAAPCCSRSSRASRGDERPRGRPRRVPSAGPRRPRLRTWDGGSRRADWSPGRRSSAAGRRSGSPPSGASKLTETSQVPTSAYEPLEFRHGPISVCEPGVLVVGLRRRRRASATRRRSSRGGGGARRDDVADRPGRGRGPRHGRRRQPDRRRAAPVRRGCRCCSTRRMRWRSASPWPGVAIPDAPRHLGQVVILGAE